MHNNNQYTQVTFVPNEIFDQYLPYLNQAQIKVLLVILRQTIGWIDKKTGQRKRKDWITNSFFQRKSGLSRKSISYAIQELVDKELIVALNTRNKELRTAKDRRGQKRIYYAYAPYFRAWQNKRRVKKLRDLFTFRP